MLVFSDTRDGGDLDVHAYKIDPDGSFVWGADGITLSANPDFEPAPRVAEATDGDLVFVWLRDPSTGDGDIRMQRLAPDGSPRLADGGLPVVVSAGEDPGFVEIASSTGNTIAPPVMAGAYAVFMTNLHGEEATGEAAMAVAQALATVLGENAAAPVPAGLGPYVPDPAADPAVP